MIAVTAQTRIWVAREPADFRCGIDGLAQVCRTVLKSDPFSGALFVFRNRRWKSIKILSYNSCEVLDYVELKHGSVIPRDREQEQLHIMR